MGLATHRRRAASKWRWDDALAAKEYPGYYLRGRGNHGGQCPEVTSTGKRCVKTFLHRRGHTTQERHRGLNA